MKAKKSLAVALATISVIGCLAMPSMASARCMATGLNGAYYGSVLEYRGWGSFTTRGSTDGWGTVGLWWGNQSGWVDSDYVPAGTGLKRIYSRKASSSYGGSPTVWTQVN